MAQRVQIKDIFFSFDVLTLIPILQFGQIMTKRARATQLLYMKEVIDWYSARQ